MPTSLCGICCDACPQKESCPGCVETNGRPYGHPCFIADYILKGGMEEYRAFCAKLIDEINALAIPGMEKVTTLYPLVGHFVNLAYPLPNGETAKFLKDDEVYLGAQVRNLFDESGKSCYGVIAREGFILLSEYEESGVNPTLLLFQNR